MSPPLVLADRRVWRTNSTSADLTQHLMLPSRESTCGAVFQPHRGQMEQPDASDPRCAKCARAAKAAACGVCNRLVQVRDDGTARSHHDRSPVPCPGTGERALRGAA